MRGGRNEVTAREVAAALPSARVQATMTSHADMPRAHGGPLLMDMTARIL